MTALPSAAPTHLRYACGCVRQVSDQQLENYGGEVADGSIRRVCWECYAAAAPKEQRRLPPRYRRGERGATQFYSNLG